MNIPQYLNQALAQTIHEMGLVPLDSESWQWTDNPQFGDLSSAVALELFASLTPEQRADYNSPRCLAQALADQLSTHLESSSADGTSLISDISVAGAGFINVRLSPAAFVSQTNAHLTALALKKTGADSAVARFAASPPEAEAVIPAKTASKLHVVEYVSPNTNKPLHIGHLRNAAVGWSLTQLLEFQDIPVAKAIIYNDRGLHIMKSVWAYLVFGQKDQLGRSSSAEGKDAEGNFAVNETEWQAQLRTWRSALEQWLTPEDMEDRLQKSDHFVGHWYKKADTYSENESVMAQWSEMLQAWEDSSHGEHELLRDLWSRMNTWFYSGYTQTRERYGFEFDPSHISYESQIYQAGKNLVTEAARTGTLAKLEDGAVKADLSAFNLPDKVLLRRDGTGIYMTFDIELTRQRTTLDAQKLIWVVGADQTLYFQQLFAVAQLLGYGERDRYYHLAHGMVRLPEGKMSSRKGRVVYGDDLLDLAVERAREIMGETGAREHLQPGEFDAVAEAVGIGAVKWTMLSQDAASDITFDLSSSVSFTGFAGPYVQYAYARGKSVLRKAEESNIAYHLDSILNNLIQEQSTTATFHESTEKELLRTILMFSDVTNRAVANYAPHLVATYAHQLCQLFNSWYAASPILTAENDHVRGLRLFVTEATTTTLHHCLELLGITPIERM